MYLYLVHCFVVYFYREFATVFYFISIQFLSSPDCSGKLPIYWDLQRKAGITLPETTYTFASNSIILAIPVSGITAQRGLELSS